MSLPVWLVRHITYPTYERLRGRRTLREFEDLRRLAASTPLAVQAHVAQRLRDLLRFAAQRLPYYRELFARHAIDPEAPDPQAELQKLPVLDKRTVRAAGDAMIWPEVPGGLVPHSSGGTSGDTLHFFIDRVRQAQDLAARLFMQSLFGVPPGARRMHLWGSPIELGGSGHRSSGVGLGSAGWTVLRGGPLARARARLSLAGARAVKRWRDRLLNERLLDAFDLSRPRLDQHLAALLRFKPQVLYGYPTALGLLARHAQRSCPPGSFLWLRLAVLTGEEVTEEQAAVVRQTFGCAVASEYGSREVGLIAHDCPHGRMHILWPHVHVEIAAARNSSEFAVASGDWPPCDAQSEARCRPVATASGLQVPAGAGWLAAGLGEIVCTTLNVRAQPLIRYRVGDVGRRVSESCPCGLPLPLLRLEGGKITGFIALPDGRLCHGAITSHILREERGIVAYKTYQHTLDQFEVLLVVDENFDPATIERVRLRYRLLFGPQVSVECRLVDQIPPDPSGKRRYVVSSVTASLP